MTDTQCDGMGYMIQVICSGVLTVCSRSRFLTAGPHGSLFSGFKEQIYDVYRYLPPATQVVLISATLPHEILEMTNKFMTDPIRILVKRSVGLSQHRTRTCSSSSVL